MQRHPNILWICADQQRYDSIRALGNRYINTPVLDGLIEGGASLTRAYTQCPVCTPSRACFLTGRYPRTARVVRNGIEYFPPDEKLVTRLFADAGYDCGLIGKLHLSAAEGMVEVRPDDGYRFFEWSEHPHDDWETGHAYQDWLKAKGVEWSEHYCLGDGKNQSSKTNNGWKEAVPEGLGGIESEYSQTTWAFERARAFIEQPRAEGQPWLLSVNIFDPHPPYDPPKTYRDRLDASRIDAPLFREGELDDKPPIQKEDYLYGSQGGTGPCYAALSEKSRRQMIADYLAQVLQIDDRLGELIGLLRASGRLEDTIVVYHSDHGEMNGDHGLYWKGAYVYEQLLHVPVIFSWPGYIPAGVKVDALTELVDLAPTLLELAGLEVPCYMQGRSLAPILLGKASPHEHKRQIYSEYYCAMRGVHNRYISICFDGRYKIAVHHGEEPGELYDLEADPNEFENLWNRAELVPLKLEMLKKCFDSTVLANLDPKPRVIRYF